MVCSFSYGAHSNSSNMNAVQHHQLKPQNSQSIAVGMPVYKEPSICITPHFEARQMDALNHTHQPLSYSILPGAMPYVVVPKKNP
jgi:hypothetical protein